MKIKISNESREALKKIHSELSTQIDAATKSNSGISKLESLISSLTEEKTKLESGSDISSKTVSRLNEVRTQLEMAQKRYDEASKSIHLSDSFNFAVRQSALEVQRALSPVYDEFVAEIAAIIRPLCTSDALAKTVAIQTGKAIAFAGLCNPAWGRIVPSLPSANHAINFINQIEAGELHFNFDPKITK